jgi:hypothetical protein
MWLNKGGEDIAVAVVVISGGTGRRIEWNWCSEYRRGQYATENTVCILQSHEILKISHLNRWLIPNRANSAPEDN